MPKKNAACSICGAKYYVCNTCKNARIAKPWHTITDTMDCYKIYMIVHNYTNGITNKEKAREQLEKCQLPSELQEHIKLVIDEILSDDNEDQRI